MKIAAWILASYLLGSIPFGFLIGRTRGIDVTRHGSGNIGFSNVLRVLGPGPAAVVLVADILKGATPVYFGRYWLSAVVGAEPAWCLLAFALAAILGHTFSVFLGFRGGRAVATTLGALLGMSWLAAVVGLGMWILVVAVTRYISVASIVAAASVPIFLAATEAQFERTLFWTAIAALIIARHIPNLGRLIEGTESKIGEKVKL
jgi:glycerol-3-phosphate acyltransferase PlsY